MSASITCSKSGCGKTYTGESFEQIKIDNDLIKQGSFYFCRKCFTITSNGELRRMQKKVSKKRPADTIGVEELYRNEEDGQ